MPSIFSPGSPCQNRLGCVKPSILRFVLLRYASLCLVRLRQAFCVAFSSVETGSDGLSSVKSGQAFYVWICLVGSVLVWSNLVMSGILSSDGFGLVW